MQTGRDLSVLNDIRRLVQDRVFARPLTPGHCRQWTYDHIAVVRSNSLGPWLYRVLGKESQAGLPLELLSEMRHDYMVSGAVALARERPFCELLAAFENQNIPVVLLKGIYLGTHVYAEPALRPMADFDLLVSENAFEQACRVLTFSGYSVAVRDTDLRYEALNRAQVYIKSGTGSPEIDLHRSVWAMDYYRIPASVIWDDAQESSLYSHKAYFLSPELNFLHLGIHNLNHLGCIRDWLDLLLLLQQESFDWERFLRLAESAGLMRPMYHLFHELSREWEYEPPGSVISALAEYRPHWLEDRVIGSRFRYPWRLFSRLRFVPGWKLRLKYLLDKIFPPREISGASSHLLDRLAYIGARWRLFIHFWRG